jgi:hypothetical protein
MPPSPIRGKVSNARLGFEEVIKGHILLDFQLELRAYDTLDPSLLAFDHLGEEGLRRLRSDDRIPGRKLCLQHGIWCLMHLDPSFLERRKITGLAVHGFPAHVGRGRFGCVLDDCLKLRGQRIVLRLVEDDFEALSRLMVTLEHVVL